MESKTEESKKPKRGTKEKVYQQLIDDVLPSWKKAQELSSKYNPLHRGNLSDDPYTAFTHVIDKLQKILETDPHNHTVLYYLAYVLYDKARKLADHPEMTATEYDSISKQSLTYVESAVKLKPDDGQTLCLWGMISLLNAKKVNTNPQDQENQLVATAERLLKVVDYEKLQPLAYVGMEECLQLLINGHKFRNRTGQAVYNLAGEFVKEGGNVKNWKSRWFVVDDSSIGYYKLKQEWESGPVAGAPARPQGSIPFADILEITCHDDPSKCTNVLPSARPKKVGQYCLHVLTKERTFNILGFESPQENSEWMNVIRQVLKLYNVKKKVKQFLRENRETVGTQTISEEQLQIDVEKKLKKRVAHKEARQFNSMRGSRVPPSTITTSREIVEEPSGKRKPEEEGEEDNRERSESEIRKEENKKAVRKNLEVKSVINQGKDLTYQGLQEKLQSEDDDAAFEYAKKLLKEFDQEGNLRKIFKLYIEKDPKEFLLKVTNVSDFKIAKFGGLKKVDRIMHEQHQEVKET